MSLLSELAPQADGLGTSVAFLADAYRFQSGVLGYFRDLVPTATEARERVLGGFRSGLTRALLFGVHRGVFDVARIGSSEELVRRRPPFASENHYFEPRLGELNALLSVARRHSYFIGSATTEKPLDLVSTAEAQVDKANSDQFHYHPVRDWALETAHQPRPIMPTRFQSPTARGYGRQRLAYLQRLQREFDGQVPSGLAHESDQNLRDIAEKVICRQPFVSGINTDSAELALRLMEEVYRNGRSADGASSRSILERVLTIPVGASLRNSVYQALREVRHNFDQEAEATSPVVFSQLALPAPQAEQAARHNSNYVGVMPRSRL